MMDYNQSVEFATSIVRGLSDAPKRLDSRFLYDEHGSAIFENICNQPEYYLTSAETSILAAAAPEIALRTGPVALLEFGSGNSAKTRMLLEAYTAIYGPTRYAPVDISEAALAAAKNDLNDDHPLVEVAAHHCAYEEAFRLLGSLAPVMFLFLGSNIGNFDMHETTRFWQNITRHLPLGNFCLLGIDINSDPDSLFAAYNDAAGFSAAFTRNIFTRMNRELETTIDTDAIEHVAAYNSAWRRVEIFARFQASQEIRLPSQNRRFEIAKNESVLTEISRKFDVDRMIAYLRTFGLATVQVFPDQTNRFAVLLLERR